MHGSWPQLLLDAPVPGFLRIAVTAEPPACRVGVGQPVVQVDFFAVDQLAAAHLRRQRAASLWIQLAEKFDDLLEPVVVMPSAGSSYVVMLFIAQAAASMWPMAICRFAESLASGDSSLCVMDMGCSSL